VSHPARTARTDRHGVTSRRLIVTDASGHTVLHGYANCTFDLFSDPDGSLHLVPFDPEGTAGARTATAESEPTVPHQTRRARRRPRSG
jgi:hypothetical protein